MPGWHRLVHCAEKDLCREAVHPGPIRKSAPFEWIANRAQVRLTSNRIATNSSVFAAVPPLDNCPQARFMVLLQATVVAFWRRSSETGNLLRIKTNKENAARLVRTSRKDARLKARRAGRPPGTRLGSTTWSGFGHDRRRWSMTALRRAIDVSAGNLNVHF